MVAKASVDLSDLSIGRQAVSISHEKHAKISVIDIDSSETLTQVLEQNCDDRR